MKKLLLKTALITFGITVMLFIAVFGIISFCAPRVMMNVTASLGLESVSGDYAYQEYERSGDIECLAKSFEIAAKKNQTQLASARFKAFYEDEGFDEYCTKMGDIQPSADIPALSYRSFVCSQGVTVVYRTHRSQEDRTALCEFAVRETPSSFPRINPMLSLCWEAISAQDGALCVQLLSHLNGGEFAPTTETSTIFNNIKTQMEEVINE